MGGGVPKGNKVIGTPIDLTNLFQNCTSSTLPTMDIPTVSSLCCTFQNMINLGEIAFQHMNMTVPCKSLDRMCDGCFKLLREPTGIVYTTAENTWCSYRNCISLRPAQYHSFPVSTTLGGLFQHVYGFGQFDSYTIDAPVTNTIDYIVYDVKDVHPLTINVNNPEVRLDRLGELPRSSANNYTFDLTIKCPRQLTGSVLFGFKYRWGMRRFPYGVTDNGNVLMLTISNINTAEMFYDCTDLKLPTTAATRTIVINIPNSVDCSGMFYCSYIWGENEYDILPIDVVINAPLARNISNLIFMSERAEGSINHLTIKAPKATEAEKAIGSLYAKGGYILKLPSFTGDLLSLFNDDIRNIVHVVS